MNDIGWMQGGRNVGIELTVGSAGPGTVHHPRLNTLPIAQTPDPLHKLCPASVLTNFWLGPTPPQETSNVMFNYSDEWLHFDSGLTTGL